MDSEKKYTENSTIISNESPLSTPPETPKKKEDGFFKELFKFTLLAICIVLPIRFYIAEPFIVSGASMFPTFDTGDYLVVDELSYHLGTPARGDVVIFHYPKDTSKYFIKRIIGLPGETVDIKGTTVTITNAEHPNGMILGEEYIKYNRDSDTHMKLTPDEYFVMGDNRFASSDSRIWGPLERKFIVGKAFVQLFPLQKISLHPGAFEITSK